MKNKLIISMLAAMLIVGTASVSASADVIDAQGAATNAQGEEADADGRVSTGAATMEGENVSGLKTTGDDDDKQADVDSEGTDINVWASVVESHAPVYKLDITWGAMKFQFNRADSKWNPETHSYEPQGDGVASWSTAGFIEGTNNRINIVNHSSGAVDARFNYAMDATNLFNDANNGSKPERPVEGNFFATNDAAVEASLVLDGTNPIENTLLDNKVSLETAVGTSVEDAPKADVFFAFSGTPDEGTGTETLKDFKKVGVINVTISAATGE